MPAPPPPPMTLPPDPAPRLRGLTLTRWQIAGLLIAVALVASVATAGTGLGLVYYLGSRAVPTTAPAYRAPAYQPNRTDLWADYQREQEARNKASCDRQWREYQEDYAEYQARKASGSSTGANLAPFRPWC